MITAILIDDEQDALESLTWEINKFCNDIRIIDSFTNPEEAISAINYLKPDCVFLDIEMPEMDGFQLLSELKFREFDLVITTAYDNYAVQAFKESAVGYLLKPIDTDDLISISEKIIKNKGEKSLGTNFKKMLNDIVSSAVVTKKKVALSLSGRIVIVKCEDVLYCKSDGSYTTVHINNSEKYLLSKKIKEVKLLFDCENIIRVHQSYLVNANFIKEYVKKDGYYLVLENGKSIPVSRVNRSIVQEIINNF